MPRDVCDFPNSGVDSPLGPVVFDDNDTLILAHEALGSRLLALRPDIANGMISRVSYGAGSGRPRTANDFSAQFERIFRIRRVEN